MASNVGTFYSVWVTGGSEGGRKGDLLLPLELGGSEKRIEREIRQAPRNQNPNPGVVFAPFFA